MKTLIAILTLLLVPTGRVLAGPAEERTMLVGICLGAAEKATNATALELQASAWARLCDEAPVATLARLQGGRLFPPPEPKTPPAPSRD